MFHAARIKHKWFKFLPHGVVTYNIKGDWVIFDPCNNPADAMPIIKDNLISLEHDGIAWMVSCVRHPEISVWDGCENYNDNFYRKAMELFLLMKDAENEK
ncbi:TPA: recombinase [Morganella morganii]